jgi:DUF971 family protein
VLNLTEARRLPGEKRLRLTWSDGHRGEFDYSYLRGWCPCAVCQGHGARQLVFHPAPAEIELRAVEPVGRYGISLRWSDGHATGIYRFDLLRHLCPCAECLARRGATVGGAAGADTGTDTVQ